MSRRRGRDMDLKRRRMLERMRSLRQMSNELKLQRGECALHPRYNEGRRKFVTQANLVEFDWDHRDPELKTKSVSNLVATGTEQKVRDEITKCDLVCANCHRRKTQDDNYYLPRRNHTQHPTLFE